MVIHSCEQDYAANTPIDWLKNLNSNNIARNCSSNHLPNLQDMRYSLLLVTAAIFLLSSCGKMQDPVFTSINNVRFNKLDLTRTQVILDVQYFNPNQTKAKLKKADGEAW